MSFGCSVIPIHGVYCFRRRVILSSSTGDAQNVFANEERFQMTGACEIRTESHIFTRDGTGVDFMHAVRVDGDAYSESLLANTVCPNLPPLTRGSHILCLSTGRRIPPEILPYISYHDDRL